MIVLEVGVLSGATRMSELVSRTLVGRYELLRRLGRGAFGAVYEALDRQSGVRVALKALTRVSPLTLAQFKQEFRGMQEVHHRNLVRLEALFEDRGTWFIAMELIEGTDLLSHLFTEHERFGFAESELRAVFFQLATGLEALHAAGFVHRDLKPANVRVTPQGRAVLLDFGLTVAADLSVQTTRAIGHGTLAYMAPEQAARLKVGPAADWYAFGVCLYEAMTGVQPIDGETPLDLLAAKQRTSAPRPSSYTPGLPADLDELCRSLLELDPRARPGAAQVRWVLARPDGLAALPLPIATASAIGSPHAVFEGRVRELQLLEEAFARVGMGEDKLVLVEGESGIGKSALVEHFIATRSGCLMLRSRCYENELLAYKAFGGAIDTIASLLAKLPRAQCEALLPPRAAVLCRLFPEFEAVQELAGAGLVGVTGDPSAQRLEAFSVLTRLLAALCERAPIVFAIDDLQWADSESFHLLQAWLDARPGRCLILATVRPAAELNAGVREAIAALRRRECTSQISLLGLPHETAMSVARGLMGARTPAAWLESVVGESAGHPLFLTVLARYAESRDPSAGVHLTLDDAIMAPLHALSEQARKLLATAAIVGSPLSASSCGRAAGVNETELPQLVSELCSQKLLRRRGAGEIACFHDRIRQVAVADLPLLEKRALHVRVAAALAAQGDADPAEIGRHHELGGELGRAQDAYVRGAERASSTLAFARAALLYERALRIATPQPLAAARRTALQIARGHALACDGRSQEAAEQYLEAARAVEGEDNTRLQILATQHLLQSACVEAGLGAARALLGELGVPMQRSVASTLARLTWDRMWLGLLGLDVPLARAPIAIRQRMQLDALWGVALPLSWFDPLSCAALSARHLRLARASGDPTHMARALAEEAFGRELRTPGDPMTDVLLTRARALQRANPDPTLDINVSFREATVAILRRNPALAETKLQHAQEVAVTHCPDQPWLLTNLRVTLLTVWTFVGEHAKIASSAAAWLAEGRERDDRFALALLETFGGQFRHLMAGEPDRALASLSEVMAPWPQLPVSFAHFGEMFAVVYAELYRGGDGALRWIERERARLSPAPMFKLPAARGGLLQVQASARLGAYRAASGDRRLLTEVRALVEALKRADVKPHEPDRLCIEAQFAALEGDLGQARSLAQAARQQAVAAGQHFLARCLDYFEGALVGGTQGAELQAQALAFFGEQGWKDPRRAVAILCPALDAHEAPI